MMPAVSARASGGCTLSVAGGGVAMTISHRAGGIIDTRTGSTQTVPSGHVMTPPRKTLAERAADMRRGADRHARELGLDITALRARAAEHLEKFARPGAEWPLPSRLFEDDDEG